MSVAVIGLGRFGTALATTLVKLGHDVLGIDSDGRRVASLREELTHIVEADSTDIEALKQLGVPDFERAVVAIGGDLEASILTTGALVDLKIPRIWAKAMTEAHERILKRVGAHDVVYPEARMGEQVAHRVAGRMMEFIELDPGFALVEAEAPLALLGRSLADIGIRARYDVTVVCVKPRGGQFTYATADTVLEHGDIVVVAGETDAAEAFASLS